MLMPNRLQDCKTARPLSFFQKNGLLVKFVALGLLLYILNSCVTNKKLTYLQYSGIPSDTTLSVTPSDYRILPFDNLYIRVVTPDPRFGEMFNLIPSTTAIAGGQNSDLIGYKVDSEGNILLPYAGKVKVSGTTIMEATSLVDSVIKSYVTDPAVTVKLINNNISLLGEMLRPGSYTISRDRMNIFQALALGGDLNIFSDRQKVQIIRPTLHGNVVKEFCLSDRSILTSEYFYVMPNDVIYAKPIKGKFFKMDSFPYAILISTITTGVLLYNVIKP
jgi:polysaccharide biosynthesis/export protein